MRNIIFLMSIFLGITCIAQEEQTTNTFQPATLKDTKSSLQNRIKFPKTITKTKNDVNIVVRCDAYVMQNGKFSTNFCFENGDALYPYVTSINRAAKKAVINPGRVNGTTRKVYFQYYVLFQKKENETSVKVIPNSGLEVEKYGFDYSSPQRYKLGSGNFGAACGHDEQITVNAVIDEKGVPESVAVLSDKAGEKCKTYLKETFLEQKYIPAMANGKVIKAYYSEEIFDNFRAQ